MAARLAALGLPPPVVSTGSTPSMPFVAEVAGVTEVRPGVYVFGDLKQVELGTLARERVRAYRAGDGGQPPRAGPLYPRQRHEGALQRPLRHPDLRRTEGLSRRDASPAPARNTALSRSADLPLHIGDKVEVIPNHACATCNMHDELLVVDDHLVDMWPVLGRGKFR